MADVVDDDVQFDESRAVEGGFLDLFFACWITFREVAVCLTQ